MKDVKFLRLPSKVVEDMLGIRFDDAIIVINKDNLKKAIEHGLIFNEQKELERIDIDMVLNALFGDDVGQS